jgi:hypothetical protein
MWLELIRERPALAADLLGCVRSGLVPDFTRAHLVSENLSEHAPASYHADAVVTLGDEDPSLAVVLEVQRRPDRRKHLSWPAYVATARARLGCPTVLLVICPNTTVAAWARHSIRLGHPGLVLTPLVLGPQEVPVLTDWQPDTAPELTVMAAAVHGAGPDGAKVLTTMLDCMENVEPDRAQSYIDEVLAVLPSEARKLLEGIMKTRNREYKSDFARHYFSSGEAKGKAEGRADIVLAVLSVRGITVSESVRARITECTDLEQLEKWGRRAVTADSIEDVFGD